MQLKVIDLANVPPLNLACPTLEQYSLALQLKVIDLKVIDLAICNFVVCLANCVAMYSG